VAYGLIASVAVAGNFNGNTTGAIDTTGADLLVLLAAGYSGGPPAISDSKSNTWTALTQYSTGSDGFCRIYYVQGGTVGSGHTFTVSGGSSFAGCAVQAWSGSAVSPFDQQNGANLGAVNSGQPGSVTPTTANQLVIAGLQTNLNTDFNTAAAVNGGFTITDRVASIGGTSYAFGLAYLVQTSAAAANPTWTWTSAELSTAAIATFKESGGGPPATGKPFQYYQRQWLS
jgi:hypothetical protein